MWLLSTRGSLYNWVKSLLFIQPLWFMLSIYWINEHCQSDTRGTDAADGFDYVTAHAAEEKTTQAVFFCFFFPLLTLGVCLCVDVCTSVGERSAVCGSTGTPRGPIRRRQIKLHLFWSWCRRWRGPERKPRPPAALQLFTAGVKVACLLCLLWKNDFFFFFHRPILGCLISPGRVSH